jgi:hypothetical protein
MWPEYAISTWWLGLPYKKIEVAQRIAQQVRGGSASDDVQEPTHYQLPSV